MPIVKVPHAERGSFAAFLFAIVDENDLDRKADVKSANGGYELSERLYCLLNNPVPAVTKITEADLIEHEKNFGPIPTGIFVEDEPIVLEDESDEYLAAVKAELKPVVLTPDHIEGAPASANVDRETIRIWAKENGYKVAAAGALKKTVIEAYDAAHATL